MKKIYFSMAVATVFAAISVHSIAATTSSVNVKSDNASVSYTYSLGSSEEAVFDAEKLFINLDKATITDSVKDTFVIMSNSADGDKVELLLRLELGENYVVGSYSPLDYYSFVISDEAGDVVYDSAVAELSDPADIQKDISLGVFNDGINEDTKTYNIEYKVSKDGVKSLSSEDVADLTISLVSRVYAEAAAAEDKEAKPSITPKPKFEIVTDAESKPTSQPENLAAGLSPATQPNVGSKVEATENVKEKKLVCGTDIDPGRYIIKGNGIAKVESEMGELESETTLNDGSVSDITGVELAIITLSKGDVLTITPLTGQKKAVVSIERTNSGSSTPDNTGTETRTASASGASASNKTNPKTGEGSVMAVAVVMALAVVGVVTVELTKRKKAK